MTLDLSENNILYLLRIGLVAVLINIVLSLASSMFPLTNNNSFPFSVYDEMISMLRHHKRKLLSSSILVGVAAASSVLFLPLLLENVEFLR